MGSEELDAFIAATQDAIAAGWVPSETPTLPPAVAEAAADLATSVADVVLPPPPQSKTLTIAFQEMIDAVISAVDDGWDGLSPMPELLSAAATTLAKELAAADASPMSDPAISALLEDIYPSLKSLGT